MVRERISHLSETEKIVRILERTETVSNQDQIRIACKTSNYYVRPLLHKLFRAGFIDKIQNDGDGLKGEAKLWKINSAGKMFREVLEGYVNA